jgi:hypothetical protein
MKLDLSSCRLIFNVKRVMIGIGRCLSRSTSSRTYAIVIMESKANTTDFEVNSHRSGTSKAER